MAFKIVPRVLDAYTGDSVILGGTTAALKRAVNCRAEGKNVLLCVPGGALYAELDDSGAWFAPVPEEKTLFPKSVFRGGVLWPNALKLHGETLCEKLGIRVLYLVHPAGLRQVGGQTEVRLAASSGLYAISAAEVYDLREETRPAEGPGVLLMEVTGADALPEVFQTEKPMTVGRYTMPEGSRVAVHPGAWENGHRILELPVTAAGEDPFPRADAAGLFALLAGSLREKYPKLRLSICRRSFLTRIPDPAEEILRGENALPLRVGEKRAAVTELPPRDVLVIGCGTSGAQAAIYAASAGANTASLEANCEPGGTMTVGGVSSYWYGAREQACRETDRLVAEYYRVMREKREPIAWTEDDVFLPGLKAAALSAQLGRSGAVVYENTVFLDARADTDGWEVLCARNGSLCTVRTKLLVDATGDGTAALRCGADWSEGDKDGFVFWSCLAAYPSPGDRENTFYNFYDASDPVSVTEYVIRTRAHRPDCYDHGGCPERRESRHVRCLRTITLEDVFRMDPERGLYACFSNYDPKGRVTSDSGRCGLMPPNLWFEMPPEALLPVDRAGNVIPGLLVGGKAFSCTHDAFAGLRMQACLQEQGRALGIWSAASVRKKLRPHEIDRQELICAVRGAYQPPERESYRSVSAKTWVKRLRSDSKLHDQDQPCTEITRTLSPAMACMLLPADEVVPPLAERLRTETDPAVREMFAHLLCYHGSALGLDETLASVNEALREAKPGLPRRKGSLRFVLETLPDHGAMPETVYALNAAARTGERSVIDAYAEALGRLVRAERDWENARDGIWCWCESFALAAEHYPNGEMRPLIRELLTIPELAPEYPADAPLRQRFEMLRVILLSAMET